MKLYIAMSLAKCHHNLLFNIQCCGMHGGIQKVAGCCKNLRRVKIPLLQTIPKEIADAQSAFDFKPSEARWKPHNESTELPFKYSLSGKYCAKNFDKHQGHVQSIPLLCNGKAATMPPPSEAGLLGPQESGWQPISGNCGGETRLPFDCNDKRKLEWFQS